MRAVKSLLCCLLVLSVLAVPALASDLEAGTGDAFYVQDNANVLSSQTEQLVVDTSASLEQLCDGAQLVVVTVSYLDEDADIAANRLFSRWGIGDADQSNGMLLFLVANTRKGGIVAGDGIDEVFYDGPADDIMEEFWDDVDRDRFDDAVQGLTESVYDWYLDYYDVQAEDDAADSAYAPPYAYPQADPAPYTYYDTPQPEPVRTGLSGVARAVIAIVLILLLIWILGAASRFSRMRHWGYTGGFFPIFWFGGGRRYRTYRTQFRPAPPPPPPGAPPAAGGFRPSAPPPPARRSTFTSGAMGRSGGGRPGSGMFRGGTRPSGGSRPSGGMGRGGGGHSGGGFRGRR